MVSSYNSSSASDPNCPEYAYIIFSNRGNRIRSVEQSQAKIVALCGAVNQGVANRGGF